MEGESDRHLELVEPVAPQSSLRDELNMRTLVSASPILALDDLDDPAVAVTQRPSTFAMGSFT